MKQKEARRLARKGKRIRQVAVLPFRRTEGGGVEVMLLTSRQTRRFVVPKGWPMKGRSDRKAAAIEARQEAGLAGEVGGEPLGTYEYWKRLASIFVHVTVAVYPLEVAEEKADWREKDAREKRWMAPEHAALLVDEPELATLIERLPAALAHRTPVAGPDGSADAAKGRE